MPGRVMHRDFGTTELDRVAVRDDPDIGDRRKVVVCRSESELRIVLGGATASPGSGNGRATAEKGKKGRKQKGILDKVKETLGLDEDG